MDTPSPEEKYSGPKLPPGQESIAKGVPPPPRSSSLQRAAQAQPVHYVDPTHTTAPYQPSKDASDGIPALDFTVPSSSWADQTALSGKTLWRIATIVALIVVIVLGAFLAINLAHHSAATASGGAVVTARSTATPNTAATATPLPNAAAATVPVAATATTAPTPTLPPPTATHVPPTATATPRPAITFDNGFTNPSVMRLNGNASFNGASLRLTHSDGGEISSAYYTVPMYIGAFTSTFTYQAQKAYADGFTFIVQGASPTALGQGGSNLGFVGISKSMAVLFKFYNEPNYAPIGNETGMSANGQLPSRTNLSVPLYSGHLLKMTIRYDGSMLSVTTADTSTGTTASQSYTVNIPSVVGGSTAYVGFTGATGTNDSTQDIVSWHLQS